MTGLGWIDQSAPTAPASPSTLPGVGDGRHEQGPAVFSEDRRYRYTLTRRWDDTLPALMVIGLNPSTADESVLDPTLRRVRFFAKRGPNPRPDEDIDADPCYGGFIMTNLFAFRATKPEVMKAAEWPVGPDNNRWLEDTFTSCVNVLCAWGTGGGFMLRDRAVMAILNGVNERYGGDMQIMCLKETKGGHPQHPLYVKGDTPMRRYVGR